MSENDQVDIERLILKSELTCDAKGLLEKWEGILLFLQSRADLGGEEKLRKAFAELRDAIEAADVDRQAISISELTTYLEEALDRGKG